MDKEIKLIRISKAAREFNIGISIIVEFLSKKGYKIDPNPNTKLTQDAYDILSKEYNNKSQSAELKQTDAKLIDKNLIINETGNPITVTEIEKPSIRLTGKSMLEEALKKLMELEEKYEKANLKREVKEPNSNSSETAISHKTENTKPETKIKHNILTSLESTELHQDYRGISKIKKNEDAQLNRKIEEHDGKTIVKNINNQQKSNTENPFRQKPSGLKKVDYFKPVKAFGTLKFFDYRVNKFGFIIDVKCATEIQNEKVHISESGLATQRELPNGEKVIFTLNKGNRGFYATNVKEFSVITTQTLSDYTELFGNEEIVKVIRNSFHHDFYRTYYENITPEKKESIRKLVFSKKDIKIWELLVDISDDVMIEGYLESIIPITEVEKIEFINKSFHINLLKDILSGWTTNDKPAILSLVDALKNKQILEVSVPKNFVDNVKSIEWNFDEIWKIYSCFKLTELKNEVLQYFSFKNHGSIERFKSIAASSKISVKTKERIQENLVKEIDEVSAGSLIDIFINLLEYQIISDENHLLELLDSKNLNESNIEELISLLTQDCSIDNFRIVISNSIKNIRDREILEILKKCDDKNDLAKVIIDAYCSLTEPNRTPDYLRLLNHYRELENHELLNYILANFSNKLSEENPFEIFELALLVENIEVQKVTYQKLTFNSEDEIEDFIKKIKISSISSDVKASNKPLSGFINLIKSKSSFKLTPDCQKFLQINKGKIQSHTIKFLIYQHYKGKISKSELKEILNSFQWTEISAILIISFIQETNYSEKFLLNKLDAVYKKHYEILNEQTFDRQSFFENFSINNFLNMCDGRKYYDMKRWEKNGQIRWYMDGDILHESWDSYDSRDFYCEGRPWKRENIWDAQTNKPITRKIDFYWCRNKSCAGRNDSVDLMKPYNNWTLVEITEALKIPVEKNVLANLAGWVNRINRILEHLFCRKCNEILRPLPFNPTVLGFYAVPVFNCINNHCAEYGKRIRLTHCLNGKCESHLKNEPLDSRDCKSCRPNDPNHTGLKCNFCEQACPACSGHTAVKVKETW